MEGTKHEKALLVILSYIVGLTSGFIAFGLTQSNQIIETPVVTSSYEVEAHSATPEDLDTQVTPETAGVNVSYDDGRLIVNVNGSVQLLSVERSLLNLEAVSFFTKQGTHSVEPVYQLSPDTNFIYFCEQKTVEDSCQSFVYDIQNEMIHYVTTGGSKLLLPRAQAEQIIWEGSTLTHGQSSSDSPVLPWLLTTK